MSSLTEYMCGAQGVCKRELLPEGPHVWSTLNHQRFQLNRSQPLVFTPAHLVIYSKSPTYKLLSGFKDMNMCSHVLSCYFEDLVYIVKHMHSLQVVVLLCSSLYSTV